MAGLVAAAIVAGGPIVGDLRAALLSTWPRAYVPVLATIVGLGACLLLGFAAYRLRGASWSRGAVVAVAALTAVACAAFVRTGDTNVDVVEAFHFVEYGGLALVLAWALEPVVGGSAVWWALLVGVCVGVADEWLQWFVPGRTGEIRDVGLNAVAVACGGAIAGALHIGRGHVTRRGVVTLGWGAALTAVAVTAVFTTMHLGHVVTDPVGLRFLSRASGDELRRLAGERARRWETGRVTPVGRFGREDQYLSEALWHVRRRNDALNDGEFPVAAREHAILERYFTPVLGLVDPSGVPTHALPPEQAAAIRQVFAEPAMSDANPLPILVWSPLVLWVAAATLSLALIGLGCRFGGR